MKQSISEDKRSDWFLRQLSGVGFTHLISIPLMLIVAIVLARFMGPEEYGQYAFLISILTLLSVPVVAGLPQLLTKESAQHSLSNACHLYSGIRRTAIMWVFLLAILILVLVYMSTGMTLGAKMGSMGSAFWLGLALIPINGLLAVHNGLAKGIGFPALAEAPTKVLLPLFMLLAIYLLVANDSVSLQVVVESQVLVSLLTLVIAFLMLAYLEPARLKSTNRQYALLSWIKVYLPLLFIGLVGTLNAQISTVLLGVMSDDTAVAGLRVAERASQFVAMPLVVINTVIAPLAATLFARNAQDEMQRTFQKATRGAFAIAIILGIFFIAFGEWAIAFFFGPAYVEMAYAPLAIITIGQLMNVAAGPVGVVLMMCNREKLALLSQMLGLAITVFLGMALIPSNDQVGAALAMAMGLVTWNVAMSIFVRIKLGIRVGLV